MNTLLRGFAQATFFLSPCFALAACGSSDSPAGSGGAPGSAGATSSGTSGASSLAGAGTGDATQLVGSFQLKVTPATDVAAASTTLVGKIYDGPTPAATLWENPQKDGACTLTTPSVPFCNTACGGSAVCVADDTCQDYPTAHGVGTVTVTGVQTSDGQSSFTMSPLSLIHI